MLQDGERARGHGSIPFEHRGAPRRQQEPAFTTSSEDKLSSDSQPLDLSFQQPVIANQGVVCGDAACRASASRSAAFMPGHPHTASRH